MYIACLRGWQLVGALLQCRQVGRNPVFANELLPAAGMRRFGKRAT